MNHFKLEYDIKCESIDIEKILNVINDNIYRALKKEIDNGEVKFSPTITKLD